MGTRNRKRMRSSHHNLIENPKSKTGRRRPKLLHPEKEENSSDDPDLLSSLPDSILSHVISFLDTRSAIGTSILSKRYKLLWTQVHSLDFKSRGSIGPYQSQVLQILKRREPVNLTRFRLSSYRDVSKDFLRRCVEYAACHKVQNLRIGAFVSLILPSSLLDSSSLITLRLNNAVCRSIELPMTVNLPNLKVLHLKYFEFSCKSYNGNLFRGCPSLENLVLHKCLIRPGDNLKILDLNCLNLKNLEIKHWRSPWRCFNECMIEVNAPKLVSFKFQGYIARVIFKAVSYLDAAYIDLSYPTGCNLVSVKERMQITSASFTSMLWHLRNIKLLSLSWKTVKVLSVFHDLWLHAPIMFVNLRLIKFTAENMYSEIKIPVQSLRQSVETVTDDVLVLNDPEYCYLHEQKDQKGETKYEDTRAVAVPANVVLYLLENSPSAEFFHIEIPEESSDENMSNLDISL